MDLQVASLCSTYVNPICISKVKSNIMQSSTQFFVQLNSGKLIYWECCLKALGEDMYVVENIEKWA